MNEWLNCSNFNFNWNRPVTFQWNLNCRRLDSGVKVFNTYNNMMFLVFSQVWEDKAVGGVLKAKKHLGYWPSFFCQNGWILAEFLFCVFKDQDGVEVHKLAKKELGQYQAILTEKAWSILLFGLIGNFLPGHGGWSRVGKIVPSCPLG